MGDTTRIVLAVLLLVGTFVRIVLRRAQGTPALVTAEAARNSLEKLQDWTKWLVGLQIAVIAAMGFLSKGAADTLNYVQKDFGFFALLAFGLSTFLSSLNSVRHGFR